MTGSTTADRPAGGAGAPGGGGYPVSVSERFFVLVNPHAAGGSEPGLASRIAASFAEKGASFDLFSADSPEVALEAARRAATSGCRAVVAAGGDGTVAQALRGTVGTEVPVAILPFGTGNQLAANFGIPPSLQGSVEVAVEGRVERIDLGRIDEEYFALIAGAGLDAEVMAGATAELKARFGFGAYLYSGLKSAITPTSTEFHITVDDEELHVAATMVLLANMSHLAAGSLPVEVQVAPSASFRDGLLDVCVLAPRTMSDVAGVVWKMARQKYGEDDRMLFLQARRVRVEADPPVPAQVDGEPRGETPFEAEVVPGAGRILVPA